MTRLTLAASLALLACQAPRPAGPAPWTGERDAGPESPLDAGAPDGGLDAGELPGDGGPDAGIVVDAGTTADAGLPDAGSSATDAGAGCPTLAGGATPCAGAACPFASASPGDVVSLGGLDVPALPPPALGATAAPGAATLIFSDDPETVPSSGILYADTVGPGPVRLFVYHVNGATNPVKITVVLENPSPGATVLVQRLASARAGPSSNYLYVGKVAIERWLQSGPDPTLSVPPGQAALLDSTLDGTAVPTGDLMHAIIDLSLDGPLRLVVAALDSTASTLASYGSLSQLPRGAHQRGTFQPADVVAAPLPADCPYDTAFGALRVALGEAGPAGIAVTGFDATTGGAAETLAGQYGVRTTVNLDLQSSDGRSLALLVNPRGGAYGGAATFDGSAVTLPAASTSLSDSSEAILVGTLAPGPTPRPVSLVWSMPGGSSGPVDLLLVPY